MAFALSFSISLTELLCLFHTRCPAQEAATAWKASRPLVVMQGCSGLTAALAGRRLGARGGASRAPVPGATTAEEAVQAVTRLLVEAASS